MLSGATLGAGAFAAARGLSPRWIAKANDRENGAPERCHHFGNGKVPRGDRELAAPALPRLPLTMPWCLRSSRMTERNLLGMPSLFASSVTDRQRGLARAILTSARMP
jgi:hypothetical protein